MAVPAFLNTEYRYLSTPAITDVNTIISDLDNELTSLSDPWIDESAVGTGPWRSPDRADGAFIKISATRISATRIAFAVNDHTGLLVNNATDSRLDIDAGGTEVRYFTGPFHVCIDSVRATPETWFCAILDKSPEMLADPRPTYVAHVGPRNNAGTLLTRLWSDLFIQLVGGTSYASTTQCVGYRSPVATGLDRLTFSGSIMFAPYEVQENGWFHGRICQVLIVDDGQAHGTELVVPIDIGTTGTFKVVGAAVNSNAKIAFRKA